MKNSMIQASKILLALIAMVPATILVVLNFGSAATPSSVLFLSSPFVSNIPTSIAMGLGILGFFYIIKKSCEVSDKATNFVTEKLNSAFQVNNK